MSDLSGGDLLREWQSVVEAVVGAAASMTGQRDLPRQLLDPLQRQFELMEEILERERGLQREMAGGMLAPIDALFDLLHESSAAITRQAEALEAAGRALQDAATVMRAQGEVFADAVARLRQPTELAKSAAGVPPSRPAARRRPRT
jgi:hypothetical protein